MFEKQHNPDGVLPGKGDFVAARGNVWVMCLRIRGAFCADKGGAVRNAHSTCGGRNEMPRYRPGKNGDMFDSTRIIAEKQYEKAEELGNQQTRSWWTGGLRQLGST